MLARKYYKYLYTAGYIALLCFVVINMFGCCNKKKSPPGRAIVPVATNSSNQKSSVKHPGKTSKQTVSTPLPLLQNTGLNFAIGANQAAGKPQPNRGGHGVFAEKYVKGMELMSAKKFADAEKLFDEMGRHTSNPEEASIAQLCIAEIYFRNKSNAMALKVYEEIVQKFPKTQAAENAKAGIEYLKNFSKYEKDYISPDVEDQKRRGY